jgi:sortase A
MGLTRLRALLAVLLLCASVVQGGQAAWIRAKGHLAQFLLERSWSQSIRDSAVIRPWPWADTWPVARLRVPRLKVSRIVMAGASGESLAFGPGLVDGSAMPGDRGNSVIAGHRDTQFRFLDRLREGDRVEIEIAGGGVVEYNVSSRRILDSRRTSLVLDSDAPILTLVSCYPFDAIAPGGPLRYVVTASLVSPLAARSQLTVIDRASNDGAPQSSGT